MAKNLADSFKGAAVHFPERYANFFCRDCFYESNVKVADRTELRIDGAKGAVRKFNSTFDLRFEFGKHSVLIWLRYKDRPLPGLSKEQYMELGKVGLLCIDVDSFNQRNFARENMRFSEAVRNFILHSGQREWIYHPKTEDGADKAKINHHCNQDFLSKNAHFYGGNKNFDSVAPTTIDTSDSFRHRPVASQPTKYQCLRCKRQWIRSDQGRPDCPGGCGHLYSSKIGPS